MKKRYKDSPKIGKKMDNLSKVFLIAYWAKWGVRECNYSGRCNKDGVPMVYEYDDHNGTYPEWVLMPITDITTGYVLGWNFIKENAKRIADAMNKIADMMNKTKK